MPRSDWLCGGVPRCLMSLVKKSAGTNRKFLVRGVLARQLNPGCSTVCCFWSVFESVLSPVHRISGKMPCSGVTDSAAVSPVKKSRTEEMKGTEAGVVLKFAKLSENATAPSRGSAKAAGYDLYR